MLGRPNGCGFPGLWQHGSGPALSRTAAAEVLRQQWVVPVANAAISVGLLLAYVGVVWTFTLSTGAESSRVGAPLTALAGFVSIAWGHRRRRQFRQLADAALAELEAPQLPAGHLRADNHNVNRRSWRRHASRCRVRIHGHASRR